MGRRRIKLDQTARCLIAGSIGFLIGTCVPDKYNMYHILRDKL